MKQLSCKAMGADCDYVAKGENEMEVIEDMKQHAMTDHPDFWSKMKQMPKEEMDKMKMEMQNKMENV